MERTIHPSMHAWRFLWMHAVIRLCELRAGRFFHSGNSTFFYLMVTTFKPGHHIVSIAGSSHI